LLKLDSIFFFVPHISALYAKILQEIVLVSFNVTGDLKFKNQILELVNIVESFPTLSILLEHDCLISNYADA